MALENFRTQKIIWDRANKKIFETIEANSGDSNGRKLVVQIINQEATENLSGATLSLGWKHRNGAKGLDAFDVVDASKGIFEIYYTTEMLSNVGNIEASLILIDSTSRIESSTFTISVRPSTVDDESVESENSFTALTEALVKVNDLEGNYAPRLNEITTQLAQTTNEISAKPYRNEVRLKRDSIGLNDADAELLSAIEGGEGTTFNLLSIPREKSVTPKMTTFFTSVPASKNLFNPNDPDIVEGKILNAGGSFTNNSAYNTSGFILVSPDDKISISKNDNGNTVLARAYGFYDESGNWISGYSEPSNPTFPLTAPENAYIFRVTYSATSYNDYQVEIGEVPTSYEPYVDNHFVDENIKLSVNSLTSENGVFSLEPASKNLFNPNDSDIVLGAILTTNGGFTNNTAYNVTGFIPVKKGDKIYVSKKTTTSILVRSYGWYDKQKNWIEGKTWSSGNLLIPPFIAPDDGYFRTTYTSSDNEEYQIEIGDGVTSYEPFVLKNFFNSQKVGIPENASIGNTGKLVNDLLTYWYGKKVVFQGDSITAGYLPTSYNEDAPSYAKLTSDELGMMYSNFAIGGSTIAENPESPTEKDPIVNRYQLQDDGADLVIIAAGTNDWSYAWTPVGTTDDRTKNTFYGALHYLILGLLDKYPDKQLLFMTPIKRRSDPFITNANGKTLEEYADIIKEVCEFYGVPVLDMFRECPILPHLVSHRERYIPDEVHPNGLGHRIMARRVTGYLRQLA